MTLNNHLLRVLVDCLMTIYMLTPIGEFLTEYFYTRPIFKMIFQRSCGTEVTSRMPKSVTGQFKDFYVFIFVVSFCWRDVSALLLLILNYVVDA